MAKNKHLTDFERLQIQHGLSHRNSIKKIAFVLDKSPTTISREIRKRAIPSNKCPPHRTPNRCVHRFNCSTYYLCEDKPNCIKCCSTCKFCNNKCPNFVEDICKKLSFPPYVCNSCPEEHLCVLRKKYYFHNPAHQNYRNILVKTREGVNISEDELIQLDEFISPLILKGQSVHHIVANNKDEFSVSEKSLYRYVADGLLKARNIDMPRVCRLKPRSSKPLEHKVDSACRIGRTYDEYKTYLSQNNDIFAVEMDSVVGRIGGKVLLTLMFKSCDLMLAFIRDRNTSQSVIDVFNWLYKILERDLFSKMLPVLLGDNGSEFSNPTAIEFDSEGNRRTKVFYCDPRASFQKPNVELNHEFIRKVLPKGSSFDNLEQSDINLMMSHINSYSRAKLNDKSPHESFAFFYGQGILEKLGLMLIPPNEIVLKPSLLKK